MNYEALYQDYLPLEKELKDKIAGVQKLYKALGKGLDSGDLKSVERDVQVMERMIKEQTGVLEEIKSVIDGFDRRKYFEEGEFTRQMLEACENNGVDVKGEYPVYEMFPSKLKIDAENQDLYLDRKKVQCMRPQYIIKMVKASQDKLMKASFNALSFANELADAYDLALLKKKKAEDADFYLLDLYRFLAPMGRFRKDYDKQSFAFDLARLYASGLEEIKDGRKFQFGPSRNENKAIRILDKNGNEQYLATIRFYA